MEQLLKVPEAAARLQVGRTKLHELVRRGELRPVRIGRALRFRSADLDAYIRQLAER